MEAHHPREGRDDTSLLTSICPAGAEGPPWPLWPHHHPPHATPPHRTPKSRELCGLIYTSGRWERPRVSPAGAGLALSPAALRVHCIISGALGQGLGILWGAPVMGHVTPSAVDKLAPPVRTPRLGSSAQWRMGGHCASDQRRFQHTQSLSSPRPLVEGLCEPGS